MKKKKLTHKSQEQEKKTQKPDRTKQKVKHHSLTQQEDGNRVDMCVGGRGLLLELWLFRIYLLT
jgi:hypothetical protein